MIKLHLWFWGERPYGDKELRRWAQTTIADWHLYNPVQPHYTALPSFEDVPDPFCGGSRVRYLKKEANEVAIQFPALSTFPAKPAGLSDAGNSDLHYGSTGKVIDGRETLLRGIRWNFLLRGHCHTESQFFQKVWEAFHAKAETGATVLSGNVYDREKVASTCARDWASYGTPIPAVERATLSADEATRTLNTEITAALENKGVTAIRATAGLGKTTKTAEAIMSMGGLNTMRISPHSSSHINR